MALPKQDAFTGADGTDLHTYDAGWVHNVGTTEIRSNAANTLTLANTISVTHWEGDAFDDNQYAKGKMVSLSSFCYAGPAIRCAGGSTDQAYGWIGTNSGGSYFGYADGSGWHNIGGNRGNFAIDDVVELRAMAASTLQLWKNGSQIGTDISDATYASGYAGIVFYDQSEFALIDDWEGGNTAGGGGSVSITDTGSGTDSINPAQVSLSQSDTGAGVDTPVPALVTVAPQVDSGTSQDILNAVQAVISILEIGNGADAPGLAAVNFTLSDTGQGIDTISGLQVSFTLIDTGIGVDEAEALVPGMIEIIDALVGTDSIAGLSVSASIPETGIGADALTITVTIPTIPDTGAGVDDVIAGLLLALEDAGVFTDQVQSVSVVVPVSDSGAGIDLITAITAVLSVIDAGVGTDVAVNISLLGDYKKLTITFSGKAARLAISGGKSAVSFSGKKGKITFEN